MQSEMHPELAKLSFLLGRWEGLGVAGYPDTEEFQFTQVIEFTHDGHPHLNYRSQVWRVNEDGSRGEPVTSESGYWRVRTGKAAQQEDPDQPPIHVEVLISHPEGYSEVYLGTVFAHRVELHTDVVVRTETGLPAAASHRLYGLFGDNRETLGYAWDLAANSKELQPYMSAQLQRVDRKS
ncbi:FABP family protein [Thermobifida fusca]|jgi:hypothetical protein|uniref:Ferric nitrobindin-like protein n=2 Tax=Thermobifida fusca TaxID=2021 RepID=NBLIK_THEFY|nr:MULTISPECIES: FABP family protein [Thermobifida]Q47KW7.1 RecName: Full=Ferric nitrobindin-like protein [Thermobifida fusca YX]AAZ56905.1 conserved hypothetical protein [Thermobifida fusca YX]EOR70017.1 hypothetical protein TM51_14756 [Thermobifida fusca TM51]MBO2529962.1 FABP family protein [Thermobifida sp.]MDD6791946.1 FABP family protein [Thermobifida fusca]PPS94525.1 fatty acid-binding protein [Thermobifida fusca]